MRILIISYVQKYDNYPLKSVAINFHLLIDTPTSYSANRETPRSAASANHRRAADSGDYKRSRRLSDASP